uniref:Inner membrane protein YhjD n=1 Tax=Heterorhabditis bacteriophora TaxID=37862 RepID=A0A1I7WZJ5_HETBA
MREEPRGKASAQESPEKKREKLTDKLTFLGVFQTYRPSASKLTIWSVVCAGIAHTHNK